MNFTNIASAINNAYIQIEHKKSGIAICVLIMLASFQISDFELVRNLHISPLIISIILGMIFSNLIYKTSSQMMPGIKFSSKSLLKLAIILLGFQVSLQDIQSAGIINILISILIILSTFFISYIIGHYVLKIDYSTIILIGSGCAICGASAILATNAVLKNKNEMGVAVSISIVTIFGTILMFLYPYIYNSNLLHFVSEETYGIFVGATIHEIAQVSAAGYSISEYAGQSAIISKLSRVILLTPVVLLISLFITKRNKEQTSLSFDFPWFIIFFLISSTIYSIDILPKEFISFLQSMSVAFLSIAMAALGINITIEKISKAGIRPIILGLVLFFWLIFSGYSLVYFLYPN